MSNVSTGRLVFGDDGSETADLAWLWITEQAWPGWAIDVVTAQWDPLGPLTVPPERRRLRPERPPWSRRSMPDDADVSYLTADGDPRHVLGDCSDADLLVVGHRGHGVAKAIGLGSTADWLLHLPPAPLAIIRSAHQVRHVVLCADGSRHAVRAAHTLGGMPWVDDCRITILSVGGAGTDPDIAIEEASAILAVTRAPITPDPRGSITHSLAFDVRSTILRVIEEEAPDLVVMGTRGLGAGDRILRGSIAAAVAHRSSCSVLVAYEAS